MLNRRGLLYGGGALAIAGVGAAYAGFRSMGSMEEYNASVSQLRSILEVSPELPDIVRYATLAANSHNTQAWLFKLRENGINIRPDLTRRLAVVDPDNHHLFASLGCAAENLAIAASASGKPGVLRFDQAEGGSIAFDFGNASMSEPALFDAIPKRQSTRSLFSGQSASKADLAALAKAAAIGGVDLVLITGRSQINEVRDLVIAANTAQMADPLFIRELKDWLRFNPRQALQTGDGLFSVTTGNPSLPNWLGPVMLDLAFKAASENEKYAQQIETSAGLAVFSAQREDPEHWVLAGRSCQRFALQATALGMKHAFINQPVEVQSLRSGLATVVGLPGRRPDILMRFGFADDLPFSARRPVASVLA